MFLMETVEITLHAPGSGVIGGDVKHQDEEWLFLNLEKAETFRLTEEESWESRDWHLGFKRTVIRVNGGKGGPGGCGMACVHDIDDMKREEFLALTDDDFRKFFDSVKKVPAGIRFTGDAIKPCIDGWKRVVDGKVTPNLLKGWKLRLADGKSFAKMMVVSAEDDGSAVAIKYGFQPADAEPMGETKTVVIKDGDGFSFGDGSLGSAGAWDIRFEAGEFYMNSAVSGPGMAGGLGSRKYSAFFDEITNANDGGIFFMDEYGRPFRGRKWYRYNLMGKHRLHVNGNVYLINTGQSVFKFQIFGYSETPEKVEFGRFAIRFAQL